MDKAMGKSTYNVIELVGSSPSGWEEAIQGAMNTASFALTNMRVARVVEMDAKCVDGSILEYRVKVRLSFKNEIEPETL